LFSFFLFKAAGSSDGPSHNNLNILYATSCY
jgi:hypothetical protein